ncbi:hypothetical protein [Leptospira idonii]|uniref:Uncharacterized protein n=1 Tax=Leptospira idonii TaxID=1193500 RepID=A0A4R9LZ31_9LEPT|nr:hypothetical protein [Leptospira idonii]TGN19664.1 hypothetical protein EHS15_07755 [Leptospira idonii]
MLDLCPNLFPSEKSSAQTEVSHLPKCHETSSSELPAQDSGCQCPLAFQEIRDSDSSVSLQKSLEIYFAGLLISAFIFDLPPFWEPVSASSLLSFDFLDPSDHFLQSVRLLI